MESNSSNCFSYQQLTDFVTNKMNSNEQLLFQQHLLKCELCRYAVKGFELIPFTQKDIGDINKNVDKILNKEKVNIDIIKHAFLAGIAAVVIFIFYNFVDSFSKKHNAPPEKFVEMTIPTIRNKETTVTAKVVAIEKSKRRITKRTVVKSKEVVLPTPNSIQSIKIVVNEAIQHNKEIKLELVSIANAVYIYDLKVADYFNLYFQSKGQKTVDFNNHIPSFKENKLLENGFDNDINSSITLESILKKGLFYFSEENYTYSLNEFQKLLALTPNDINALFYGAMAYNKIGNYEKAIMNFNKVLNHTDRTFHAETKWFLAKSYVSIQKTDAAKQLFIEIMAENGFYAKNAKNELMQIKQN